jgi:threonine aldolase
VFVDLAPGRDSRSDTVGRLRERGLLCTGIYKLRLVAHLDVSRADIERAVTILRETL